MSDSMHKARVSLVKASDYKSKEIHAALRGCLDYLGGLMAFIKPRSKVFIKINHLSPTTPPEKAVVTHPLFTKEVIRLLKDLECEITVGDDVQSKEQDSFLVSGYRQLCTEMGIRLVNLKEIGFRKIKCEGQALKEIFISPLVLESDFIINLPKLKTHSFTAYTGAVKNMFGTIPYGLRLAYHLQFHLPDRFSDMLVDIFSCARPHLNIMDGIIAMEGEGPGAGKPRKVGVILASSDALALDTVATKITGFNPLDIYTNQAAHERGLGIGNIEEIDIIGETIRDVEVLDFEHSAIAVGLLRRKIPQFLYAYLQSKLALIPEVSKNKCTVCMECVNICPRGAIKLIQGKPRINNSLCINCMCCHESCGFQAIKLKQQFLGRTIRGGYSIYKRVMSIFP